MRTECLTFGLSLCSHSVSIFCNRIIEEHKKWNERLHLDMTDRPSFMYIYFFFLGLQGGKPDPKCMLVNPNPNSTQMIVSIPNRSPTRVAISLPGCNSGALIESDWLDLGQESNFDAHSLNSTRISCGFQYPGLRRSPT